MSKFERCARIVLRDTPSYAWIALHRCVEAHARLTGEPFRQIFARLGAAYGFGRAPADWPGLAQMRRAVEQLQREHAAHLAELNERNATRRLEKRRGRRVNRDLRLAELLRRQGNHQIPRVGYWGWRTRRLAEPPAKPA